MPSSRLTDDGFRVAHDARHQFGAGRNVVDQPLHLACRPDAFIGIAGGVDHLAAGAGDELANVPRRSRLPSPWRRPAYVTAFLATREVLRMVRKISSVSRSSLATMLFLDQLMDRALLGAHETRAHVDAFGAQRQVPRPGRGRRRSRPEAIIGIFTLSAATGIRIRPGVSSSPGWPAHSKPSIEIASTPMRSADRAWRTLVHLCTTTMPCFLNSVTCSCGLLPAVSTILMPLSMMA